MGLTGAGTVVVAVVLLAAVGAATALAWNRLRRGWAWPARVGLLLVGDVAAVVVVALLLNDSFVFYGSWTDLWGGHSTVGHTATPPGSEDAALHAGLAAAAVSGHGLVVSFRVPGVRSHLVTGQTGLVYLPPQYGDPAWAAVRFPVVELLDGFPGSPQTWTRVLHVEDVLDTEISDHEMSPSIVVLPVQNVADPRDTECANVAGGPQVDTYLTFDVRTAVTTAFRASTVPEDWAVAGYSTGGYCAAVMSARHPEMFGAAASIEGYNDAAHDHTTGDLFGHDTDLADRADMIWWMHHKPSSPVPLLAFSSRQDLQSYHDDRVLDAEAAAVGWPLWQVELPAGGHNPGTFGAELPVALGWISHRSGNALAPVPTVDGLSPTLVTTRPRRRPEPAR